MGAGASASVEGGRTVSDELFGKLDEAKAGVLTLVELDAAVKKLSASDEQVASMAQKKWSMFGDGWDLDADEDDPSKTVDADGFYAIVTRVYPHLAAPAAAAAEPAEDEAATKLQCAMRAKQAKATVELKRSASAAPAPAPITAASIAALPQLPKAREAPAALGSARGVAPAPDALKPAGERPLSAELVMERPKTAKKRKPIKVVLKKDAPETADAAAPAAGEGALKDPVAHAAAAAPSVVDPAK